MRRFLKNNSLSLAAFGLFLLSLLGQALSGAHVYNDSAREHGRAAVGFMSYLATGEFTEALFENWESEFFQMAVFQLRHGGHAMSMLQYLRTSQFWFESFQNWQSEFLSVGALVLLSIFLRERGSPQSKPVAAPHHETD